METNVYIPEPKPEVTLKFENSYEPRNLLEELHTWTPVGGWSNLAKALFDALEEASGN
jgi:hypothetical protein